MLVIPVNNAGSRRLSVVLGDHVITVRTYWNSLASMWFMDLSNSAGEFIAQGLAMVPQINLLRYSPTLTRIYGQFRVAAGADGNATETSLGNTATLLWFAPGEFEALAPEPTFMLRPLGYEFDDLIITKQIPPNPTPYGLGYRLGESLGGIPL